MVNWFGVFEEMSVESFKVASVDLLMGLEARTRFEGLSVLLSCEILI